MQNLDVVIVGGGIVGLTTALAIRKQTSLTVGLVESQALNELSSDPHLRVSAINGASQQLFTNLGVWQDITNTRLQPYKSMHVWDKDGYGHLDFTQQDFPNLIASSNNKEQNLGWIVENDVIRNALWNKAEQDNGIVFITEKLTSIAMGSSEVFLMIEGQAPVTAKLVIGADGANSWVRKQLDMAMTFRDYDHHALVASVKCSQGHQDTAWQVFLPTGPLAFLPLYKQDHCSIVWSLPPDEAQRIKSLSEEEFNKEILAASDGKLGQVSLVSERATFPLTMRLANEFVKDRVVLVGDAAHTIHPLAGQGVNLGLVDVSALAQTLEQLVEQGSDISDSKALGHFSRWRKADASEMIMAMESIKQGFSLQQKLPKVIRGLGMSLLNQFSPAKKLLIKQALGFKGELPKLSQNQDGLL
ncbi:FAD-dependent monooxygenase [Thalassomonas sp. M1454]|uniref:FAD-dependent monooxygenase n=1 Tax=Thalassomonas sp. M1454 TaxID=2594477 RepID=UPI00117FE482|nr:FAD-dependent monooxygenase [Thalassomonas sp. M1454]TRX54512.1 FAD-dependent oxidoreductase [Thalassomonas sp. M1454]